ncbi:hypothetical protein AI2602V1_1359 [Citrobacter freundii]|uniref:hypothetical protein n=1 Tax=Citrobacter freundii TaxID=546 RepID=UPI000E1C44C9|nr:hypothetical protein [Citrobacter freundii]RDT35312.1 hypothetical protein DXF86_23390 [Citrobacter freundii]CAE6112595.1 hypothetical protein AI2602V1_1359 [Citrobacter freundii]CAH3265590.1 hypothetical protein AI2602V1_1359 [Citrobacter freundii]CAH6094246.1 hypothetical protein AI3058V1_2837 [Citrobacter freundii]
MKKVLLITGILGGFTSSAVSALNNEQSHYIAEFNKLVANNGKDSENKPVTSTLFLHCDEIKQKLTIDGTSGKVITEVNGIKYSAIMSNPSFPDGMVLPDDVSDADGWDYYFQSASGYLTILTKNNGSVRMRVKTYSNGKETEIERPCKGISKS